jgi:signal transduction histidine kinase
LLQAVRPGKLDQMTQTQTQWLKQMHGYAWLKKLKFAFPVAALAALALMLISEGSYRRSVDSLNKSAAALDMRVATFSFLHQMTMAEGAQRGFLLTGRPEYLAAFPAAMEITSDRLGRMLMYYGRDPARRDEVMQLADLYLRKTSEIATTLRLYSQGKHDAWLNLVLTDIGREQMDRMALLSNSLLAHQVAVTDQAQKDVVDTLLLNRIGVSTMVAFSLLALFMFVRQAAQLDAQRLEQRQALQAERDKLEGEVARRTSQLIELAQHLQTAREDERNRLALELHDELGGLLTAAKLDLARMKSKIVGTSPDVAERMAHLVRTLDAGIALKRRIIEDLRPSSLKNLGLVAALEILTSEFAERSGIPVSQSFDPVTLSPKTELTVYRLVQEALTNISKYASATQVAVALHHEHDEVVVSVQDNGVGFDTEQPITSAHGLLGMRFRVQAAFGELNVASTPGQGTRIVATLPAAA